MAAVWQSLYLWCDDRPRIQTTLETTLQSAGYTLYNPFGLIPGDAYQQTVKLFIAPTQQGCTRLIGQNISQIPSTLSQIGVCLSVILSESSGEMIAYVDGEQRDLTATLTPLVDDPAKLQAALSGQQGGATTRDAVPLDVLPEDVQEMAQNLNIRQINKMFNKLMKRVNKQVSGDADAAQALLHSAPDWQSATGQRIQALLNCLNLNYEPDFSTLRDAYQLHIRQHRKLYPGEAEMMAAVPDALDYIPVYGGKKS